MKIKLYPFYSHRRDPVLDNITRALNGKTRKDVAERAGVSTSTLNNWSRKDAKRTMRPKFMTVAAVARSMGEDGIEAVVNTIKKGK